MSWYRVYEIDILRVGQLYLQQGIDSLYPAVGTVLTSDGSGGTVWSPVGGSQAALTSTILGLGNVGYLSTQQLQSTVNGLGNIYLSTGGGGTGEVTTAQLTSTVRGLGSVGYISSLSSFQSKTATISSLTTSNFTASTGYISSLAVDSITFGDGTGWIDFGVLRAQAVSTVQINSYIANLTQVVASSLKGDGSQITNLNAISSQSLQSTVIGLGNIYLSTGGGGTGEVTSVQLQSTTRGLGTAGYISTPALSSFSTAIGTVFFSQSTGVSSLNAPSFTGLQANVSSLQVNGLTIGTGTGWVNMGPLQAIAVSTIVFTTAQATVSSIQGDGSLLQNVAGLSTVSRFTSNSSNWTNNLLQNWSTSLSTVALFTSNTSNWASNLLQNWSTPLSTTALFTSNTSNYFQKTFQDWSSPLSTVSLFTSNTSNYYKNNLQDWSTQQDVIYAFASNTSNYYKSNIQDWSTPIISTTRGLGTAGYVSSLTSISSLNICTGQLKAGFICTGQLNVGQGVFSSLYINATPETLPPWQYANSKIVGLDPQPNPLAMDIYGSVRIIKNLYIGSTTTLIGSGQINAPYLAVGNWVCTTQVLTSNIYMFSYNSNYPDRTISYSDGNLIFGPYSGTYAPYGDLLLTSSIMNSTIISTVRGLGNIYVSTTGDAWSTSVSTVARFTSNTSNYYSNLLQNWSTPLTSTTIGLGNIYVSTGGAVTPPQLASTINGLGIATYISSAQLTSSINSILTYYKSLSVNISTLTTSNLTGLTGYISSLQVDSLQFGDGTGWVDIGPIRAVAVSTIQINVDTIYANQVSSSTFVGDGSQLRNLPAISSASLQSTVRGLGNFYISSISSQLSTVALFTSNTSNYFQNTVQNWSTPLSSVALFTSNTSNYFQNTVQNWSTPLSTVALFTSNTSNYFQNTVQDWSTSLSTVSLFTSNAIVSTTIGLGNIYISTAGGGVNASQLISTTVGLGNIYLSTSAGGVTVQQLLSTTIGLGNIYISTAGGGVTNTQLISTTSGLGNIYLSTISQATQFTSNTSNYFQNTFQNWSTPISTVALFTSNTSNYFQNTVQDWSTSLSTVALFTSNVQSGPGISSLFGIVSTGLSTTALFTSNTSNWSFNLLQNYSTMFSTGLSTVALFTSNTSNYSRNLLQNYSTMFSTAVSTVALFTSNTSNYFNNTFQNWSTPLSTVALFTSNSSNWNSNLLQNYSTMFSTAVSTVALFTSNTSNYFNNTVQNWSTAVSTVALFTSNVQAGPGVSSLFGVVSTGLSTVALFTSNTSNFSRNILQDWSTPIISTTTGLGTARYISSAQLTSSITGILTSYRSLSVNISTLTAGNLTATTGYISSLQVDSLQFGDGNGWADFGAIRAVIISTIQINTDTIFANQISSSTFLGDGSQLRNLPAISSASLQSTVRGLGNTYLSSISQATLFTSNTSNYTVNLLQNYSTMFSTAVSTVALFTSNTSNYFNNTVQNWSTPLSTVALYTSNTSNWSRNILQDWSTQQNTIYQFASNTSNYYSNVQQNWSTPLSTVALFTSNTSNWSQNVLQNYSTMFSTAISTATLFTSNTSNYFQKSLQDWSTSLSTTALFTSNTSNYFQKSLQDWSTSLSTTALFTSNTSNYFQNTLQDWSTSVSTVALFTSNSVTSTTLGLARIYLSSFSTTSLSTGTMTISTIGFMDVNSGTRQSLYVSSGILVLNGQGIAGGGGSGSGMTISDYVVSGKLNSDQTIVPGDPNKVIQFSDDFDPQNWYDPTNYRFTPTIAGYYYVTYAAWFAATPAGGSIRQVNIQIDKNSGTNIAISQAVASDIDGFGLEITKIVYMNGSTDNLRFNAYVGSTSNGTVKAYPGTWFSAALLTNGNSGDNLISTVTGLGTAGYVSTIALTQTSNYFKNLLQNWSTPDSTIALFTSNTSNYYSNLLQNWSTPISSLQATVSSGLSTVALFTSNTSNWSRNILQDWSTPVTSTTLGFARIYLSSFSTFSLSTGTMTTSTLGFIDINTNIRQSLYVSSGVLVLNGQGISGGGLSGQELISTVNGLGTTGYISTISTATQFTSNTSNWSRNILQNYSTMFSTAVSTVALFTSNTSNYYANLLLFNASTSMSSFSTAIGTVFYSQSTAVSSLNAGSITGLQATISSLQVNAITIGTGTGWVNMGPLQAVAMSTIVLNAAQAIVSSVQGDGSQLQNIAGLSTVSRFTSNTSNYFQNTFQNWSTPLSTVALFTSNTSNYFQTTVQNWSSPLSTTALFTSNTSNYAVNLLQNYSTMFSTAVSTVALFTSNSSNWTSNLLQNWSSALSTVALFTSNTSNWNSNLLQNWSTSLSTVALFTSNTSNYYANTLNINISSGLSTVALFTSNTSNFSKNILQDWSTSLISTTIGLGTARYISSAQLTSSITGILTSYRSLSVNISTLTVTTGYISSLQVDSLQFGDGTGWADFTALRASTVSTIQLNVNTIFANQVSSSSFIGDGSQLRNLPAISSASLESTVRGLGTAGYASTIYVQQTSNYFQNTFQNWSSPLSTVALFTSNTSNFYSNLQQNWSTSLYSSLIGLGTFGYISTGQFLSSQVGMFSNISSFVDPTELASTIIGIGSAGFVSSIGLTAILNSTVTGLTSNISTMIDPTELTSTVIGLGTVGLISSTQLDKYLASTTTGLGTAGYASTIYVQQTSNYFQTTLQNWSSPLSTVALYTSNTSNFARNILQDWSTPLTSTTIGLGNIYLSTVTAGITQPQLTSTAVGLGTFGYVSSSQLVSTVTSIFTSYKSLSVNISTLTTSNLTGLTGYISSLQVDSLQFGDGTGWIDIGPIRTVALSTIQINVDTIYANQVSSSSFIGDGSQLRNLPAISSASLQSTVRGLGTAGYASTVYVQQTSNYFQNTVQNWSSPLSTVALYTSNTSNYFQNTVQNWSTPLSTVALYTSNTSNYFQNTVQNWSTPLSTVALYTSNTSNYATNLLQNYSTMFSTAVSTVALFTSNTSNYFQNTVQNWSSPLSTVALFTSNTSNYANNILQDFSTPLSTVALFTSNAIVSTTLGLGTAGYVSSLQLQSTTTGLTNYISTYIITSGNTTGEVLYLNYSKSLTSPYKALELLPTTSSILQSSLFTVLRTTSNQSVIQFKTDFTLPSFIPTGIWDLNLFAKSSRAQTYLYASLHLLYSDNTEQFLTTSAVNPVLVTPANSISQINFPFVVPYTNISSASLVLRIYANTPDNQDDNLTTYYENGEYSHLHTTFGTIIPEVILTSTVIGLGTAGYISTAQYNALSNFYRPLLSNDYSTNLSTVALFTSNTSNYFSGLQGSTLSLSTGNVTTSSLYFKDPYATSIAIFQSSSLLFYGNVVLAGYGQLQPQFFTF